MENLEIYNKLRECPTEAIKPINAGRLKGMSDINPMWRIKAMTEVFGPCGIGWWYTIDKQWLEHGNGPEVAAFCNITLFYKVAGEESHGIPGTGGSGFVKVEKNGPYTSDECFKMALTDAISVAAKALGAAANIYWQQDRTKYEQPPAPAPEKPILCEVCGKPVQGAKKQDGSIMTPAQVAGWTKHKRGKVMCITCEKAARAQDDQQPARIEG
jgi:hypothetical protein